MQTARSTAPLTISSSVMKLRPLDDSLLSTVSEWLANKQNHQWLDFGYGNQLLTPATLKIMAQRESHVLRVFTNDFGDVPLGLIALSNISRGFRYGTLWYVLGAKDYSGKGYTKRAVSRMLAVAFEEMDLHSVNAWAVEANRAAIRVLSTNNFQLMGRQRRCHYIDGVPHDRLMFDLLRPEFKGIIA